MPIKATLYEYGVSSFLQIFTSQNDYKTTKLYYSTQPVLLPVKKHPKATCRKRAEYNLELAKYDFEMPANLEDSEIAAILPKVDELVSWVNDIKEYALQQALSGTVYDGYKVVEGRANRKYTDEDAVAFAVKDAGYDPYEKKLLGITAMTSLLGKTKFNELLGGLIEKPQGKPTLVPESDKRQALNTAKDDFNE